MKSSLFMENSTFYKGNLHTHTSLSDGRLPPEEAARVYKEAGYDFMAISDHDIYFDSTEYDSESFLVLPAIERSVVVAEGGFKWHHIHGVRGTAAMVARAGERRLPHGRELEKWRWRGPVTVQQCMDELHEAGNLTICNHPTWSRLELEDLVYLTPFAIEIYNHLTMVNTGTGNAVHYWDMLLRRGKRVFGVAADDSHLYSPPDAPYRNYDVGGGWVVVAAQALSRDALAEALVRGSFYSSTGPEIYRYEVDGDEIAVACSPVKEIRFLSYERRGRNLRADPDATLTEGRFRMRGDETFVRVECVDEFGRTAWSNPVFVSDWIKPVPG